MLKLIDNRGNRVSEFEFLRRRFAASRKRGPSVVELPGGSEYLLGIEHILLCVDKLDKLIKEEDPDWEMPQFVEWMVREKFSPKAARTYLPMVYGSTPEAFDAWVYVSLAVLGREEGAEYLMEELELPIDQMTDEQKAQAVPQLPPPPGQKPK